MIRVFLKSGWFLITRKSGSLRRGFPHQKYEGLVLHHLGQSIDTVFGTLPLHPPATEISRRCGG